MNVARLLAGVFAGASLWLSVGTLAVVNAATLTRVGALPGFGWLLAAVAIGAVLAGLAPSGAALRPLVLLVVLWLPWLPVRVPAAFLMWEGPLEAAVWLSVAGLIAWRLVGSRVRSLPACLQTPRTATVAAGLIAAAVFFSAWLVVRPRVPAGDEPHYLVITQSLLNDGDLRIENNHRDDQYLAYHDGLLRPDFIQRGVDGQIYSIHAPGVSALVAPLFALAGYPGAVVTVMAALAGGLAAAWLAAFTLTASAGAAWAAWLALLAAAPILLHGYTLYPDPIGAATVMVGGLALVWLERSTTAALSPLAWSGVGAALALLPWLHTRFAILAATLGAAIALRLVRRAGGGRALAAFAVVPALAAGGWFLYFWRIYGTPNPAAPYGARPEGGLGFIPAGVVGLLADQQFGVVAVAPVFTAAILGLWPLARRWPRLALELAAVVIPYLLAVTAYPMWWAGYSAPGRFAVAVLPLAVLPLAAWWSAGPVGRRMIAALTVVSALVSLVLVAHDRGAFIYNGRDGHALLLDWLSASVDLTLGAPSVHRDGMAAAAADAGIWLLAGVLVAALWLWLTRWRPRGWLGDVAGLAAVPLAALLALPVVWAGRDRPAVTPPTSQMAFLGEWAPGKRPVTVELTPTRRVAAAGVARRLSLTTSLRGRRLPGPTPLLQVPLVPAGEYEVLAEGRGTLSGTATVTLGRHDVPIEHWALDGRPSGFTGLFLRLPAPVHSITVIGDEPARASVRRLLLRPRQLPEGTSSSLILRGERVGPLVLFALDDNAYMEPGALWVRGERTTRLMVQADEDRPAIVRVTAGPVDNVVALQAGEWREELRVTPGEHRDVTLPAAALAPAVLQVSSASGFRPSAQDAGSRDVRFLGAYLTFPAFAR